MTSATAPLFPRPTTPGKRSGRRHASRWRRYCTSTIGECRHSPKLDFDPASRLGRCCSANSGERTSKRGGLELSDTVRPLMRPSAVTWDTVGVTVTTKIERSGRTILAVLADLSPEEAGQFEREYRDALTRAAESLDLAEAESILTRWWGIATVRANSLTDEERQLVRRVRAREDVGWSSPAAWLEAQQSTSP